MSEVCTRCGSVLKPYYWETQIPQGNWTAHQAEATAQRQRAMEQYQEALKRA